jgi:TonB family protein
MTNRTFSYAAVCGLAFAACGGGQAGAITPEAPKAEPVAAAASAPSAAPAAAEAPPAAPAASATPAAPDRGMEDIQAVINANRRLFRDCYDKSLKAHSGIQGKYVITFVINPNGSVKSAETDQSTSQIHQADMASCAEAAVRTLKFPPSKKGKESRTSYPFVFTPTGSSTSSPSP